MTLGAPQPPTAAVCPLCGPPRVQNHVGETRMAWTSVPIDQHWPHHICVISKVHVTEPFQLEPDDASEFFRDCLVAAKQLQKATGAMKINYEIHGNTIPHLHMHIFTRGTPSVLAREDLMTALRQSLTSS